jgi:signal transduction histidine kinase
MTTAFPQAEAIPPRPVGKRWFTVASLACITLLVVLILLAIMQYKWIGELRDAERRQMELSLRSTANQFADEFASELLKVVTAFQVEYRSPSESLTHQLRDAYEQWAGSASYPTLVQDLFVVRPREDGFQTYKFDPKSGALEAIDWPDFLEPAKILNAPAHDTSPEIKRLAHPNNPVFLEKIPALAVPFLVSEAPSPRGARREPIALPKDIPGWTIARLDRELVVSKMLPALFESYFASTSPAPYRVAVASTEKPHRILYQSESMSAEDLNSADLVTDLISGSGGQIKIAGPQAVRILAPDSPQWKLFVKHRLGSLDAAVETLRRRNLAIGGVILLLLAASVLLVLIATHRARALGRIQVEFAAAVSHELRTPLAVIQAAAYNLEEGVVEDRNQVRHYARTVRDAVRRLSKMVDHVLLLAETQSWRKPTMPPVRVADVIERALETTFSDKPHPVQKSIQSDLPLIAADALLLSHCVQNLLTNAVKYGDVGAHKPIRISADVDQAKREVRIVVADRGPGINQFDLPHIFRPFYRGKQGELDPAGNGLGLAVVQQLMERQSGSVSVETNPYTGCIFTLHIPIAT